MRSGDSLRLEPGGSYLPVRIAALAALLVSAVLVTGAGVAIGGVLQERLEAGPTASQTAALERIDASRVAPSGTVADPSRGPNRADLGGGRADLGADR